MQPFLAEIKLVPYGFAPSGWAFCNGQLMSISQNAALFSLLGTTYGGNGQSTFALPDLRGRAAISRGQSPGTSVYTQGQAAGSDTVALTTQQIPPHSHTVNVAAGTGTLPIPDANHIAAAPLALGDCFGTTASGTMPANTIGPGGKGAGHENRQPYLALNYVIALTGIYPSRN